MPCCKRYTMESLQACTKVRLAYIVKKGALCGVVLEKDQKFIYLITVSKRFTKEKYWTKTKSHSTKRYTIESCWTWTKIRSSYLVNKGIRYGVILKWGQKFIYLTSLTKKNMIEQYWTWINGNLTKRYTMESYWTWTKIRSSYLVNKGIRYRVVWE